MRACYSLCLTAPRRSDEARNGVRGAGFLFFFLQPLLFFFFLLMVIRGFSPGSMEIMAVGGLELGLPPAGFVPG